MTRSALRKDIIDGVRYTVRSEIEIRMIKKGLRLLLKKVEDEKPDDLPLQMAIIDVYQKLDLHTKKYFQ